MAENNLKKANELYDVDMSSRFSGIRQRSYPDGGGPDSYSTGFNTETKFSTTLPSGTIIGLGAGYTQMYTNGEISSYDFSPLLLGGSPEEQDSDFITTTYDPVIKIEVAQPLIFNWFGFLDRVAKKDAKMLLEIEKLKKIENDKVIMSFYKKLYFSWIGYQEILGLLERSISNAKKLESQTKKKVGAGIAENDDLQKVRYQVYKYEEQYQMMLGDYRNVLNELSIFFNTSSAAPDPTEFNKYYKLPMDNTVDILEFENTRASKILNLSKKELEYLKKASFNRLLPMLNLFGNLDIKFHRYDKITEPDTDNADWDYDIYNGDLDFTVGLEFVYPLGNHRGRAELKETKLMINDLLLRYETSENQFSKGLKTLASDMGVLKTIFSIKENSIESLNSRYKTEQRKYNQARLDLAFLLDTDNTITSEEIELIRLKTNIINLYFEYLKFTE